ncbi:follistatin-related protein 5-like [Physella acuta]|uniref:follistatin-related protein 5-like n=1 Tax=Physella acuta TaxID=109671 RepID=UPI0027DB593B|nr:follistatin-related protein 5-like [Physella acuta]XP_059139430.1 follistatin-related protein 5-like [Physella acuta]
MAALLPGLVSLAIFLLVDSRPQDLSSNPTKTENELWWKPTSDKDKWRAFEPIPEVSTTKWWEQKLDDNLWDPKAADSKEDSSEESEGEDDSVVTNIVTSTTTQAPVTETSTEKTTSATTRAADFSGGLYRHDEMNAFVETDNRIYYSPDDALDTRIDDSSEETLESKSTEAKPEKVKGTEQGKDGPEVKADEQVQKQEPDLVKDVQEAKSEEEKPQGDMPQEEKPKEDNSQVVKPQEVKPQEVKVQEVKPQETKPEEVKLPEDQPQDSAENVAMVKEVGSIKLTEPASTSSTPGLTSTPKAEPPVTHKLDSIYGKGESIANPSIITTPGKVDTASSTQATPDSTEKKVDFVDWPDWNSTVFENYDEDDENDEKSAEVEKKEEKKIEVKITDEVIVEEKVKPVDVNIDDIDDDGDDDDDEEDEYYSDVGDEWDDDLDDKITKNEENYEVVESQDGAITISPLKNTVSPVKNTASPIKNTVSLLKTPLAPVKKTKVKSKSKENKKKQVTPLTMQADDPSNHIDNSHYSKGVIYDSSAPAHKPSVKKDLTNPADNKAKFMDTEEVKVTKPAEVVKKQADVQISKKEVTHYEPSQLNTESDVSTSPNPPPPGSSSSWDSTTTTPGPSMQDSTSTKAVEDDGYIVSLPIELCKVDFECRAGRICVSGMCKCVPQEACAGHHRPICGSDGVQYPSHCQLHRTACINRVHIRVDRLGRCFKKNIQEKEKMWLAEQEKEKVNIPSKEIYQFPQDIQKAGEVTQDVKKSQPPNNQAPALKKAQPAVIQAPVVNKTESAPAPKVNCTWEEMSAFKEQLLLYYCQKFVEPNCKLEVKTDREYLSMLMFSYYDQNFDYFLTANELDDKEREEHFSSKIIKACHLHDFIGYADTSDADGKITVSEFTHAFELPAATSSPKEEVEVISTLASAGNGLELKCGIAAENIVWKRHGAQLADDKHSHQLMIFDDGALFFSKVGLHHVGNYTCVDAENETKMQLHRLRVQTLPVVTVNPVTQTHQSGSDVELKCHADGVPRPNISWKLGGESIDTSSHVTHYSGGGHIVIHNAQFDSDAGTYTCSAHNQAGTTEKSVSVSILPPLSPSSKDTRKETGTFLMFNANGIYAYDPLHCLLRHHIPTDFGNFKFIPDALDAPMTLCVGGKDCQWGGAVQVGTKFIYVSQPDQNRVVIIDADNAWNPLQVVETDKKPEKLWYVKHLDQVWVLCANQEDTEGGKTIVVIRDASQQIQHRAVHTRPVGNHFDTVQDLFIPQVNDLEHEFDFGYVTHAALNGLFKLSLEDMSYTKAIDLTAYACVPKNIDFVSIGGHIVIQCVSDHHTVQLIMDCLTDTIISTASVSGQPMTSPDSRHLVTVDNLTGKVTVTSISEEGVLETTYEVTVSASISDVAFIPANSHQGYDLALTSADDDDVILMNLVTGKVEKIAGSHSTESSKKRNSTDIKRTIAPANTMNSYLMTPSRTSLAILDVKYKQVQCEFADLAGSSVMLYVASSKTS